MCRLSHRFIILRRSRIRVQGTGYRFIMLCFGDEIAVFSFVFSVTGEDKI